VLCISRKGLFIRNEETGRDFYMALHMSRLTTTTYYVVFNNDIHHYTIHINIMVSDLPKLISDFELCIK